MNEEVSKEEKIEAAETLSEVAGVAGVMDVADGLDDLQAAGEIEDVSKAALAAGADAFVSKSESPDKLLEVL